MTDMPESPCPGCGQFLPDYDGFGILSHVGEGGCGWCSHPSLTGNVCDVCGVTVIRIGSLPGTPEFEEALTRALEQAGGNIYAAELPHGKYVVAISGMIAAGKTRYRRSSGLSCFPYVDIADFYRAGDLDWREARHQAYQALKVKFEQEHQVVVFEATLMSVGSQVGLIEWAQKYGYRVVFVWVYTTSKTVLKRLKNPDEPHAGERLAMFDNLMLSGYKPKKPRHYYLWKDGELTKIGSPCVEVFWSQPREEF